jgi:hypothetical protein
MVRVGFVAKDHRHFLGCYVGDVYGGTPVLSAAAVYETGAGGSRRSTGTGTGRYWDFKSVYTPSENRRKFYCAQRLLCHVLALAKAEKAAGVTVTAQAETIRRDCFSRGFAMTDKDMLGARLDNTRVIYVFYSKAMDYND